jgi:[ribosomal protein S18]-alanine N-acetyltransferase
LNARVLDVVPLTAEHVPAAAEIHVAVFRDPGPESLSRATAHYREELARPWARGLVAVADGRVVGIAVMWVVALEAQILDVAAHPDFRRQGVGRALVRSLIDLARQGGANLLLLEVRASNAPAIALYRSLGFSATRIRARYYTDDEDAVEMTARIDPTSGSVIPVDSKAPLPHS